MDKIIGVVGSIPISKTRKDDTSADRLSHRFMTAKLIVFALVVSAKQFVGDPITCWVPAHFSGGWEEYTNSYCWIKNTYFLPFEEHIPKVGEKREMIPYYQWVPIIFLVMALFFYLPSAITVLVSLNYFMGSNFHMYGFQVLMELSAGRDWTDSHRFPRVTMCDLDVRRLGNIHRYTVQCVLPINLFNEKLFLFIWWWIIVLIFIQGVSLIKWSLRSISKVDDMRYVRKHLKLAGLYQTANEQSEDLNKFVKDYLKSDGIFILRLIGSNTNTITVTDFVRSLWRTWIERDIRNNEKHPDNKIY
ncbi:DgyrCDS11810 [Dimorphilus gyrociliatus]|uniref:Innexin n=1 Tax=Dimorphilus gyrociliatus TaxID=2664684 RepID=A0A7I8W4P8_9ANNE|nr:DgyrCDS11810 [Dimorphilus gyrociliatus]